MALVDYEFASLNSVLDEKQGDTRGGDGDEYTNQREEPSAPKDDEAFTNHDPGVEGDGEEVRRFVPSSQSECLASLAGCWSHHLEIFLVRFFQVDSRRQARRAEL